MGIIKAGDPLMLDPEWRPESRLCFACGESVWEGKPFVHWYGHPNNHIVLHASCARTLAKHLQGDADIAD